MTFGRVPDAVVVDASVAVEAALGTPKWTDQLERWQGSGTRRIVPSNFSAEVAHALLVGRHRPSSETQVLVLALAQSGIELADRGLDGLHQAIALAEKHGLTVYDALYLQLAIDVDGELATLDADLARAAAAEGVRLV